MAIQIMESTGSGLRLFEPVETIEELGFKNFSETFQTAFLEEWKWAYEQKQGVSFNPGFNTLCFLDDMVKKNQVGRIPVSFTFEEAARFVIQKIAEDEN